MALPEGVWETIPLRQTALVLIDLQRRHMDVDGVGYHTLPKARAEQVVARAAEALAIARAANLPVIHVATWSFRATPWGNGSGANPFWSWQNGKPVPGASFVRQAGKCTVGSVYAEFMPPVEPLDHEPVVVKYKYSGFYMTDLALILDSLNIRRIVVGGVNTNNCVLHTCFDAHARDRAVVVLEDACGSMNGDDYHRAAIRQIEAAIGWVTDVGDLKKLVGDGTI